MPLRELTPADLPAALALTQAQHWSHRMTDWALHLRFGRGLGVRDERDDALIGTALWWDWDAALATIGLVVVRPDQQGRGTGRRLMQALLAETGERPVGLVATAAGRKLYEDCGFVATGGIVQCQGELQGAKGSVPHGNLRLRAARRDDLPALRALDSQAVGAPRTRLIEAVFDAGLPGRIAERGGRVVGFALQRPAGHGITVGPLIAADEPTAIAIAAATLDDAQGIVRLDIPATALGLLDYVASRGLVPVDRVTAMLRGRPPMSGGPMQRFALVSQAFG